MRLFSKTALVCLAVLLLLTSGCGPSAKDRLAGKWQGSVEFDDAAVDQRLAAEGSNPIKTAVVQKVLEGLESGTISMELKADDSYTSTSQLGPISKDDYGIWQVLSETEGGATVALTSHEGKTSNIDVVFSEEVIITAPLTGEADGLGVFRCTRVP